MRRETVENALETLRKFDTVIIVDDSSSMAGTYWEEVTFARNQMRLLELIKRNFSVDRQETHLLR
jgi:hypothetical protein